MGALFILSQALASKPVPSGAVQTATLPLLELLELLELVELLELLLLLVEEDDAVLVILLVPPVPSTVSMTQPV